MTDETKVPTPAVDEATPVIEAITTEETSVEEVKEETPA